MDQISTLSRIEVAEADSTKIAEQFQKSMGFFDSIKDIDVSDKHDAFQLKQRSGLREDQVRSSLGQEVAINNAPNSYRGQFRVPPVL